jgi:hypothetical protein
MAIKSTLHNASDTVTLWMQHFIPAVTEGTFDGTNDRAENEIAKSLGLQPRKESGRGQLPDAHGLILRPGQPQICRFKPVRDGDWTQTKIANVDSCSENPPTDNLMRWGVIDVRIGKDNSDSGDTDGIEFELRACVEVITRVQTGSLLQPSLRPAPVTSRKFEMALKKLDTEQPSVGTTKDQETWFDKFLQGIGAAGRLASAVGTAVKTAFIW